MTKPLFDHEKLTVYRLSIEFCAWRCKLAKEIPRTNPVAAQLERAAVSVPLNIAEGNGKHTPGDRCRYFDIARGSALESGAALDVLVAQGVVEKDRVGEGKRPLVRIVEMLIGLIRSNSPTLKPVPSEGVFTTEDPEDTEESQKEKIPSASTRTSIPTKAHSYSASLRPRPIIRSFPRAAPGVGRGRRRW